MLSVTLTASIPLARLRQMKANLKDDIKQPDVCDNSLRGAIQGVVCLRRIKHAGLIGRFYWRKDRSNQELAAADADWASGLRDYNEHKEQPYMDLMRTGDPNEFGGLDFAQIGMTMGMDLDCFNSFLANSVKDEVTGGYKLNNAFVEIPAPPMATSITLTSLKTIAQTIIAMPVIVTQHEDDMAKQEVEYHVPKKKKSRKAKVQADAQTVITEASIQAAAQTEMTEPEVTAAQAKTKKRTTKKAAETAAPNAEPEATTESSAKKRTRKSKK